MDRGAWRAAVHGVTQSWTRLSNWAQAVSAWIHTANTPKTRGDWCFESGGDTLKVTWLEGSISKIQIQVTLLAKTIPTARSSFLWGLCLPQRGLESNSSSACHQSSPVAQSCLTLCDPMGCSTPGFPVHHQLLELAQTHVHLVGDAIQPPHLLSPPFPPAFNLSQQQGLFQWVSSSHQVAKVSPVMYLDKQVTSVSLEFLIWNMKL